jgi:hypothetical protein
VKFLNRHFTHNPNRSMICWCTDLVTRGLLVRAACRQLAGQFSLLDKPGATTSTT